MPQYAILSDIHANDIALEAVLKHLDKRKPEVDGIYCLGDLVVYGVHPSETLQRLEREGILSDCVSGNNDFAIGHRLTADSTIARMLADPEVASRGKDDPITRRRRAAIMMIHGWTYFHLKYHNEDALDTLKSLPKTCFLLDGQARLLHASPCDSIGMEGDYLREVAQAEEAFIFQDAPLCFFGHTHIPTVFQQTDISRSFDNIKHIRPKDGDRISLSDEKKALINPGSVGQPRDRDPRASYLIYDSSGMVEFHRVEYPVQELQAAILKIKDELKDNIHDIYISVTDRTDSYQDIADEDNDLLVESYDDIADELIDLLVDRFQRADW